MRHKLTAGLGVALVVAGFLIQALREDDETQTSLGETLSYVMIILGAGLLLVWLGWMYLNQEAKHEKASAQFARVEMRAIILSMIYQAMKEKQSELSPAEEAKLRNLLTERAGVKFDNKSFADMIGYAKTHQQDYQNKIKDLGGHMSHKAKLMVVKMSYLVIAADRKVEKNEVETIVEIAKALGVVRSETLQVIEDIDKSQDEIAAALKQKS